MGKYIFVLVGCLSHVTAENTICMDFRDDSCQFCACLVGGPKITVKLIDRNQNSLVRKYSKLILIFS